MDDIAVMISGKAGDGVLFTGNVLARILKKQGWEIVTYRNFPSNIRGEPTDYTIRASLKPIHGRKDMVDVLMAFDCDAIQENIPAVAEKGILLCEGTGLGEISAGVKGKRILHAFPMRKLARDTLGNDVYKNMILLGGLCYILDLDFSIMESIIENAFLKKKGRAVVERNVRALHIGCEEAKKLIPEGQRVVLSRREDRGRILISGDEAVALGALAAGCRLMAAYPICPATEIAEWLASHGPEFDTWVVQTEDEIAAINMVVGASYAGVRAMTATSGPGASLMMEGFSLAGMTEIPVVIIHVQRLGPSTGLPTKSEQADLTQWIFGSHGDFPRIVLSPGTIQECFEFTVSAFDLADRYQCPVVVLTEEDYGQNLRTTRSFDLSALSIDRGRILTSKDIAGLKSYTRYALMEDGVSPRAIPGIRNAIHSVESSEHDERGLRDESPANRIQMMAKRMRKIEAAKADLPAPCLWGDPKAEVGIIGCGSTFGPITEAIDHLSEEGIPAKFLQIRTLWPFLSEAVEEFIAATPSVFVVDNNFQGQLRTLILSQVSGGKRLQSILNYSAQTFRPRDIVTGIKEAM
ncbi:MAG: 2-oxoacid:acceptor oxidoreductase subunit alpha [Candidatus Aminicenantales bacterium]